jgi:ubiquinone/menaquinone biosynthesis C-methylase UbiE
VSSYDAFADDYDVWAADMTQDVDWYVELATTAREPIVELAVGSGRVAIEVARRTGKRVIGIDRSPKMLALARERSAGFPVDLREGDMRELSLDEEVELVICPFRSILHLPTWADRRTVFERVAASLAPGGRFAWNVFAFSASLATAFDGKRVERAGGGWEIMTNVPADSRIDITRGRGLERIGTFSLWWATRREWDGLIDVAGLELERLYGGFHREPYDDDSLEQVWVARKPG